MSHLHTDRLRNDLGLISNDIERMLHDAADDAGGLAQEARTKLEAVREQLMELERKTAERTGQRLARARERMREQPLAADRHDRRWRVPAWAAGARPHRLMPRLGAQAGVTSGSFR